MRTADSARGNQNVADPWSSAWVTLQKNVLHACLFGSPNELVLLMDMSSYPGNCLPDVSFHKMSEILAAFNNLSTTIKQKQVMRANFVLSAVRRLLGLLHSRWSLAVYLSNVFRSNVAIIMMFVTPPPRFNVIALRVSSPMSLNNDKTIYFVKSAKS